MVDATPHRAVTSAPVLHPAVTRAPVLTLRDIQQADSKGKQKLANQNYEVRMPEAAELLCILSEELGIQMIIVTHEEELAYTADKAFKVSKLNGVSQIKAIKFQ